VVQHLDADEITYLAEALGESQVLSDGEGSPLGWLCSRTTAAAFPAMAGLNTSRGWTSAAVKEPRLTG